MSLDAVRNAIVAKLAGVAGTGTVHAYERYTAAQTEFRQLYESGGEIRGWFVRRVQTVERSQAIGRWIVDHRWSMQGFRSLIDADQSEIGFDNVIEAIRDAFRADETLGGAVGATVVNGLAGVQVDDSGPVMFAGVLCHSARLTLWTRNQRGA